MAQYLRLPGSGSVTTPDHADFAIADDLDVQIFAAADDWTPAAQTPVASQWGGAGGRAWQMRHTPGDDLQMRASDDGTAVETETSNVAHGFTDGEANWIRYTFEAGVAKFWTGGTDRDTPSWVQLGADQPFASHVALFNGTDIVSGGASAGDTFAGDLYAVIIRNGIAGAIVGEFDAEDFTVGDTDTDTAVDSTGKTWTINGVGAVIEGDTPAVAVTGTVVAGGVLESEIVAGAETIILTLTDDAWVATVGADNAITDALMAGITSAGAEATGWNNEVRDNMVFGDVTRTSDTVVTIILAAEAAYAITADETITVTVPATALVMAGEVVAAPTFDVTNEGGGPGNSRRVISSPRYGITRMARR